MFAVQVFWKHCGKRRNCSLQAIAPFPTVFSIHLENSLLFCQILSCRLPTFSVWKSLKFVVWERVKDLTTHFWVSVNLTKKASENILKKERMHFLLFPQCFPTHLKLAQSFQPYLNCHLQKALNLGYVKTFLFGFPKRKILNSSTLKEFTGDNFEFDENGTVFLKGLYFRHVKTRACLRKG